MKGGSEGRARLRGAKNFANHAHFRPKTHALLHSRTIPQVLSYRCLRFILAACSLEVVYTGKIAITVDRKKKT